MRTSHEWVDHFKTNRLNKRVDWNLRPSITKKEIATVLYSLQAWQLGETSDGKHLLSAASKYAARIDDPRYVEAVSLFIKEEQKHGNSLGTYLDLIDKPRVETNWGDTLFRKVRYFNTSMEIWTLAVLVVESTAQVFYQSLKNATKCELLKQICTDILIDEAWHIDFQTERLAIIYNHKSPAWKMIHGNIYKLMFVGICSLVWIGHRKLFRAGGTSLNDFIRKMKYKYAKTLKRATQEQPYFIQASL